VAQTKHEIQAILAQLDTQPRHRFGQNFMIDGNLVRLIAEAGEIVAGDLVIEVGPGTGTLTEELLARGAHVVAVEIDRDLAVGLRKRFRNNRHPNPPLSEPEPQSRRPACGSTVFDPEAQARRELAEIREREKILHATGTFELIEGDALAGKHELNPLLLAALQKAEPQRRKLVANLPYNIASPLIIELLIAGTQRLAFTVQKEVADRLKAAADTEAYGAPSVMAQMLAEVKILRTSPPQAFWPAPKIESALVRLDRRDQLGETAAAFGRFVHQLFSARRKTVRRALTQAGYAADEILASQRLNPSVRPETLDPPTLHGLFLAATARVVAPPAQP
jgi:16S rRNA (adenine1518-N6/adenine1519-N6)-dimethyltransferase